MLWVLLDVTIAVLALVVLVLAALGLYRHAKALAAGVSASSARLGDATPDLSVGRPAQR